MHPELRRRTRCDFFDFTPFYMIFSLYILQNSKWLFLLCRYHLESFPSWSGDKFTEVAFLGRTFWYVRVYLLQSSSPAPPRYMLRRYSARQQNPVILQASFQSCRPWRIWAPSFMFWLALKLLMHPIPIRILSRRSMVTFIESNSTHSSSVVTHCPLTPYFSQYVPY
jgi:hypothetical protein